MHSLKDDFLKFQAKTNPYPLSLEIKKAKGSYITTTDGKKYLDFIAGVSACSLGHNFCDKNSDKKIHACNGLWRVYSGSCCPIM